MMVDEDEPLDMSVMVLPERSEISARFSSSLSLTYEERSSFDERRELRREVLSDDMVEASWL